MLLMENGYYYDAAYLLRIADEGGPLAFRDEEWRDYVLARAVIGDYEREDD